MKSISKVFVAGLLGLVALSDSALACNYRCQSSNIRVIPQPIPLIEQYPAPQPAPPPPAPSPNFSQTGTIINDLPVDAKRAIRAAAAKGQAVRQTNATNRSSR